MGENYISINSVKNLVRSKLLLLLITSFFYSNLSYSQCTNGSEVINWNQMYSSGSDLNGSYTTTSCGVETILSSTFTDQSPLNLTDTGAESSSRYRVTMGNVTIGDQVVWELTFSSPLILSNFRVEDIDESTSHLDIVKFTAENDGVNIPLSLTNSGGTPTYSISGQTATGTSNNNTDTSDSGAVLVNSSQPIKKLVIIYEAGTTRNVAVAQSIWFSNYSVCCPEEPTLNITKSSSPSGNVNVGDEITYTIQIENTGSVTADNVDLIDILPSEVTYVNNSITRQYYTSVGNTSTSSFQRDLGDLKFDQSGSQSFTLTSADVPYSNAMFTSFSFEVDGSTPDRNGNGHTDDWRSDIDLAVYFPGYVFYVDHNGDSDNDEFGGNSPGGWNTVSRSTSSISGSIFGEYRFDWYDIDPNGFLNEVNYAIITVGYEYTTYTRTQTNDTNGTVANLITSSEGIDIQPGETVTVTFKATVNSDTECNTLTNTATIDATNLATALSDTAVNIVNPPIATLVSNDADNTICAGDSVTFTAGGADQYQFLVDGLNAQALSTDNTFDTTSLTNGQIVTVRAVKNTPSGCEDTSIGITVTVTTAPDAGALSGTQAICVAGTTTFTSDGDTGGSFSSSDTAIATVEASTGVVTGVAAGTATITYTLTGAGGCSDAMATL
uniref:DUF7507 domain-containing protein n=1 Tax=Tenacibaculum sp. 47A_GOM-205m TaxID=1380384 RepID=UPI00056FA122